MLNSMIDPGLAAAVVDFTGDFSLLGIGLTSLTVLSVAAVVYDAVRYHLSRKAAPVTGAASADCSKAA